MSNKRYVSELKEIICQGPDGAKSARTLSTGKKRCHYSAIQLHDAALNFLLDCTFWCIKSYLKQRSLNQNAKNSVGFTEKPNNVGKMAKIT